MTKWRAVLVGAMAAGALAAGSFIPAQADETPTPAVKVVYGGDPTGAEGYIVVQGDGTVPGPVGHGYIGVDSNGEETPLVGCADGDYEEGSGENNIGVPTGAPNPNDPCVPQS